MKELGIINLVLGRKWFLFFVGAGCKVNKETNRINPNVFVTENLFICIKMT